MTRRISSRAESLSSSACRRRRSSSNSFRASSREMGAFPPRDPRARRSSRCPRFAKTCGAGKTLRSKGIRSRGRFRKLNAYDVDKCDWKPSRPSATACLSAQVVDRSEGVPDDYSSENLHALSVPPTRFHHLPEPTLDRPEDPFDHRPSSIPASEHPSVSSSPNDQPLPRGRAQRLGGDVRLEVDHGETAPRLDPLGVLPGLVALVPRHVPDVDVGIDPFE